MFEFNDQSWLPKSVRREMTLSLDFLSQFMGRFGPVAEILAQVVEREDLNSIVDLCSGASCTAGALLEGIEARTGRELKAYMTDKYPIDSPQQVTDSRVYWDRRSIDARSVPVDLRGVRTLFTAFHHFRGGSARQVLADAIEKGQSIAIFEHADRGRWVMAKMAFTMPFFCWASLFSARNSLNPSAVLFQVVFPIVPLMLAWDGVISIRRTYSIDDMRQIISATPRADEYEWWIGRTDPIGRIGKGPVYYLVGAPAVGCDWRVHVQQGGFPDLAAEKRAS